MSVGWALRSYDFSLVRALLTAAQHGFHTFAWCHAAEFSGRPNRDAPRKRLIYAFWVPTWPQLSCVCDWCRGLHMCVCLCVCVSCVLAVPCCLEAQVRLRYAPKVPQRVSVCRVCRVPVAANEVCSTAWIQSCVLCTREPLHSVWRKRNDQMPRTQLNVNLVIIIVKIAYAHITRMLCVWWMRVFPYMKDCMRFRVDYVKWVGFVFSICIDVVIVVRFMVVFCAHTRMHWMLYMRCILWVIQYRCHSITKHVYNYCVSLK